MHGYTGCELDCEDEGLPLPQHGAHNCPPHHAHAAGAEVDASGSVDSGLDCLDYNMGSCCGRGESQEVFLRNLHAAGGGGDMCGGGGGAGKLRPRHNSAVDIVVSEYSDDDGGGCSTLMTAAAHASAPAALFMAAKLA